jgi:hypothetical protein
MPLYALGLNDGLIADCDEAIKRNPRDAAAFCHRGDAHESSNNYGLVAADYSKAIQLDRTHVVELITGIPAAMDVDLRATMIGQFPSATK